MMKDGIFGHVAFSNLHSRFVAERMKKPAVVELGCLIHCKMMVDVMFRSQLPGQPHDQRAQVV